MNFLKKHAMKFLGLATFLGVLSQVNTTAVPVLSSPKTARTGVVAKLRPGQTFRDCPSCPEMVVIPAGSFTMGAPEAEPGRYPEEGPAHRVSIRSLAVGKFDVTRGQWAAFVAATNRPTSEGCQVSIFSKKDDAKASWRHLTFPQDDDHPVVCVTWYDAQDYLRWLSQQARAHYRLLTEAEWEYAARAGTTTAYPWGETASHENANYGTDTTYGVGLASGRDRWAYGTSPAGAFPPNQFGLYDMHGNVMQWVEDCFAPSYSGLPTDGSAYQKAVQLKMSGELAAMDGTSSCLYRLCRGGDFADPPRMIRSAFRNWAPTPGATLHDYRSAGLGFRIARTL